MVEVKQKTKSVDLSTEKLGNAKHLKCLSCGQVYSFEKLKVDLGTTQINVCYEKCLGPLAVDFDLSKVKISKLELLNRPKTFSILSELLPFESTDTENDFEFSELRYSKYYSEKTGREVYFKLDKDLPSGSFKDRPVIASFKRAKETGYKKVFVASTGNLAISCLKLGKKFGLDVRVYLSNTLNKKRRAYIEQFIDDVEKQLVIVNGSYDDANVQAIKDCEKQNQVDLKELGQYTTFVPNNTFRPFYKEGSKTSGYEIAIQLLEKNITKDVHVFYPLGSGALICSAAKGVSELKELGLVENDFKFYGVQQEDLNPIVKAFRNGGRLVPQKANEHLVREIAIGNPGSGIETLQVIKNTGGDVEDVSAKETLQTYLELYKKEDIFPQLCGALTLKGFEKVVEKNKIKKGDVVVINITGDGKDKIEDDILNYGYSLGLQAEVESALLQKNVA